MDLKKTINKIATESLTQSEAFELQTSILTGEVSKEQLITIFEALQSRDGGIGVTAAEMLGFVEASRQVMVKVESAEPTLDIVGTGGDGLDTINISTISAIVCSSLGLPVAKHGNRAATGKCGAADVLEYLGYKIEKSSQEAEYELASLNFVFLYAKSFNPAFRFVGLARKEFGHRTYFNFLGPLLNPTYPKYLLVGVSDFDKAPLLAETYLASGVKNVWIVQSAEGMDELSLDGQNKILKASDNSLLEMSLEASNYGLQSSPIEDLVGGEVELNSQIFLNILGGQSTVAQREVVLLNVAAALNIVGRVDSINEGLDMAREALDSGQALEHFEKILTFQKKTV